jgi:proline iminopeptidase
MTLSPDFLYPPIEPFSTQMLPVSSQHSLYVERSGNRGGYPVMFLHGGPGSQTRPDHRRYFDPDFYEIVLFDQRGCGKSAPAGEVEQNTTQDLVEDIWLIRQALGFSGRMSLFAGSWGSTLALAYALRYPQTVDEMILRGIFLATEPELDWYLNGVSRFAPQAWQQLAENMGPDLLDSYHAAVFDLETAEQAAWRWAVYEQQLMSLGGGTSQSRSMSSLTPAQQVALVNGTRVQLHYLKNGCFVDKPLLECIGQLHIPVTIVQGSVDFICPPVTAVELSKRLPLATLRILPGAGHSALGTTMAPALREECDALRDRLRARAQQPRGRQEDKS